ncbi:MAG: YbjQ family protein [Calditrichaeota bacterium]|nr:MAG: YbjQ family protein [Calditrichota bacterium]
MIVSTTETIPGRKVVKVLGIARGNTIRARHLGKDILAILKTLVGGEVEEYTKLMAEAREQAIDRMIANAEEMGANAVLSMRITTSVILHNTSEILAYGTAVVLE